MTPLDRRNFLRAGVGCAAYLLGALAGAGPAARRLFAAVPRGEPLRVEPWGRLERVADGVWVLISTPLAGDHASSARRTFANGGIVAGRDGVMVIEGLATEEGARWLAGEARRLTGRWPTQAVVTHYHGDHSAGLGGYLAEGGSVEILGTAATRRLLRERRSGAVLPDRIVASGGETELDLGGRHVRIVPREGHTASDLTVELADPRVVWCGDLVWNGLFPNFMDATPSRQAEHVRRLLADEALLWVPGHGSGARAAEMRGFLGLLESVEEAARSAVDRGVPAAEAAQDWQPPRRLGEWVLLASRYYEVAFRAWELELRSGLPAATQGTIPAP